MDSAPKTINTSSIQRTPFNPQKCWHVIYIKNIIIHFIILNIINLQTVWSIEDVSNHFYHSIYQTALPHIFNNILIYKENAGDVFPVTQNEHIFSASICYNIHQKAIIKLDCPVNHHIQTTIAFTAISSESSCSYNKWDCILQEGITKRCDGRNQCSIAALYEEETDETMLRCGHSGSGVHMYFQVEYECHSENGLVAVASTPSTTTNFITLNLEDVIDINMNGTHSIPDFNDAHSVVDNKTALVGILGGSTLAMVLLIAIVSSCIYQIKSRASKLEGYRTTSGITSTCTETILNDPELIHPIPHSNRNLHYDYRRQFDHHNNHLGRGFTVWNGRNTTYTEHDLP